MNFIQTLSQYVENKFLLSFLVSALPMSEIKGGILLALSLDVSPIYAYLLCLSGSSLPIPIILLIFEPLLKRLKKKRSKTATTVEKTILQKFSHMGTDKHIFWKLFTFVALPIPLTGVYTGSCVAALLDLPLSKGFTAVLTGNALSGAIVLIVGILFKDYADKILLCFLAFIPLFFVAKAMVFVVKNKKAKQVENVAILKTKSKKCR